VYPLEIRAKSPFPDGRNEALSADAPGEQARECDTWRL